MGLLGKLQRRAQLASATSQGLSKEARTPAGLTAAPPDTPAGLSAGIAWVPSERVNVVRVQLPLASSSARLKALPYAIEPLIGQPLASTHVALGPALGGGQYLAAAIDRTWMQNLVLGCGRNTKLVPDIFMLPVPSAESWNVGEIAGRVIVRTPDGAGFAVERNMFPVFLEAAGSPHCRWMFGSSDDLPLWVGEKDLDGSGKTQLLDLRQGEFAAGREKVARQPVLMAQIAAGTLAAYTAALGAEVWMVNAAADQRRASLAADLSQKFPAEASGKNAAQTIEVLAERLDTSDASNILTLLALASGQLDQGGGMTIMRADFTAGDAQLELTLEGARVDAFYDYAGRLEAAGLIAKVGQAAAIPGGAEARMSIFAGEDLP